MRQKTNLIHEWKCDTELLLNFHRRKMVEMAYSSNENNVICEAIWTLVNIQIFGTLSMFGTVRQ